MKKNAIALMLILLIATPSYAVGVVDTLTCKKVVLLTTNRTILVKRITGEVKYIKNGSKWLLLKGHEKRVCQMLYNNQVSPKKH